MLDHGCGEALDAGRVAGHCGSSISARPRRACATSCAPCSVGTANVAVVSPEEVEALPDGTLDLVVANSLIQYLTRDELSALLATWHGKLKPGGKLVVADVIPPDVSPLTDASQLLAFAWRGGFLTAALAGLVRTAFSDYRKLRAQYGLSTHSAEGITALIALAGYDEIERVPNFGHNPHRMTFRARKPA